MVTDEGAGPFQPRLGETGGGVGGLDHSLQPQPAEGDAEEPPGVVRGRGGLRDVRALGTGFVRAVEVAEDVLLDDAERQA